MPVFFVLYFATPLLLRNGLLLVASLAFYTIDGGLITAVLVASIVVNYYFGELVERVSEGWLRSAILIVGIALNLLPLLYYKYWNFLQSAAHDVGSFLSHQQPLVLANIVLPAGISFFTFQGLSYIIDLYRHQIRSAPTLVDFGMYHTLFPQLVAGPIVRYREVQSRIRDRISSWTDVEHGLVRFCIGLAKKIIIADSMGTLADRMFELGADQLTPSAAWIGALTYTLQIFFDFSGYSDMAIGLGRMLGFRFPENFDQPYRSRSITEFWRRWHMTLSRWFRDYLYIPLGGNRAGPARTYFNLFLVFVLCGLWHGAAYTFLFWGVFHGILLVIERLNRNFIKLPALAGLDWLMTILLVIVGWVFFRAAGLGQALFFLKAMAGFGAATSGYDPFAFLTPDKVVFFGLGVIISLVRFETIERAILRMKPNIIALRALQHAGALCLFCYSAVLIAANGFNPFIYFRF